MSSEEPGHRDRYGNLYHCPTHTDMKESIDIVMVNVRWIMRIGGGLFLIGLAMLSMSITALINAGEIGSRLDDHSRRLEKIEERIFYNEPS